MSQKAFSNRSLLSCHRTGDRTGDVSCLSPVAPTPDKAKQGYNTALEKFYCSAMCGTERVLSQIYRVRKRLDPGGHQTYFRIFTPDCKTFGGAHTRPRPMVRFTLGRPTGDGSPPVGL